jgi:TonB family protein
MSSRCVLARSRPRAPFLSASALIVLAFAAPAYGKSKHDPVITPILEQLDLPSKECEAAGKVCTVAKKSVLEIQTLFDSRLDRDRKEEWTIEDGQAHKIYDVLGAELRVTVDVNAGAKRRWVQLDYVIPRCPESALGARSGNHFRLVDGPTVGPDRLTPPQLVPASRTSPLYPSLARRARLQGNVILEATIDTTGAVGEVCLVRSTRPNVGFEASAFAAVTTWRFRPATLDGEPVPVRFRLTVGFGLE